MRKSAPVRFGSIRARPPLAMAGQKIGLLGGSFNPPHEAHRLISQIALRRLGLDQVWWIVTPGNPLKIGRDLMPLDERLALCRTMARDNRIIVTAFEKHLATTFTAATLGFLRLRHPATRFVWIMGADCLAEFHRWRQWRDIFATMPVAVIDRPGHHLGALASPAGRAMQSGRVAETRSRLILQRRLPAWTFLTGPLSSISSTAIRATRGGLTKVAGGGGPRNFRTAAT
ncbi:MAG: nicotinate-nucleotide adenylyltransferase [Hyphomicrobiaceae bacterium]